MGPTLPRHADEDVPGAGNQLLSDRTSLRVLDSRLSYARIPRVEASESPIGSSVGLGIDRAQKATI
jgi:hypothetical protein